GDIPPTLGIFITPGNTGTEHYPDNLGTGNPNHRAPEYDALSDAYTRFLIEEMLPEVAKTYKFTDDPKKRAIGGTSSGAICAWTVAWNRPDAFGNVISMIGSYTSIGYHPATAATAMIPGGDTYPGLIRRNPIRPIRIFLQDGTNDLNNEFGNWHLANEQMLSSLQWANANADEKKVSGPRYDVRYEWGDGAHSDVHGGWLLPGILRWMFG
ncbi:MAG TPA: alpha/beta hydrolase-fold protein, partial [Rhizomicrobium sp.]|nr:alpha/beta hydrolase-fold protein [Rhizomicrobium sp.]